MSLKASLPGARDAIVGQGGVPSRPLYVFLQNVASKVDGIAAQSGNVTIPDLPISPNANVTGAFSIYAQGTLQGGVVRVSLQGDVQTPGNTQYYGSGPTGERGWFNVSDAIAGSDNVTLTVGDDGVTAIDLSTGVLASLALADSSVQPGDNVSDLTNDAGYVDDAGAAAAAPVQSVNGYTGSVSLAASDVGAATAAQGALADTALQDAPSDGTIYGRKDGGWVPAGSSAGAVDSVNGQTGTVVLDASDVGAEPTISTGTSSQFWQGDKTWQDVGIILPPGYIDGHQVVWNGPNAITVTSGSAYIEGDGKVLRATSDIAKSGLSLTASTWYHLYRYDNAGTPDIEISTTAPAAPYNGTARSKTGDSSRRYVGSALTGDSGALYRFVHNAIVSKVFYETPITNAPFKVLSGSATSATTVSCSGVIPSTARFAVIAVSNASSSSFIFLGNSNAPPIGSPVAYLTQVSPGTYTDVELLLDDSQSFQYMFLTAPSNIFVARVKGYYFER